VKLGAIIVVAADVGLTQDIGDSDNVKASSGGFISEPLTFIEVAGRSTLERMVERFLSAGIDSISILVETESSPLRPLRTASDRVFDKVKVEVQVVTDVSYAITRTLGELAQIGVGHCFVNSADAYVETDLLDLFYFHHEAQQPATRAFDGEGLLALWVVNCEAAQNLPLEALLDEAGRNGNGYFVREYAARLRRPGDLRQLSADILSGRCETNPSGEQIRPGVWIDDGADVHHDARLVAPAYIGRNSKIREDALITRCSCVERDCCVDCGTVIENSSILPGTRIGIWLDVCHAVVSGSKLLSLKRDVMVEISDPKVMCSTASSPAGEPKPYVETTPDVRKLNPAPVSWRLGAELIEE
jgi:hypothetical protein